MLGENRQNHDFDEESVPLILPQYQWGFGNVGFQLREIGGKTQLHFLSRILDLLFCVRVCVWQCCIVNACVVFIAFKKNSSLGLYK